MKLLNDRWFCVYLFKLQKKKVEIKELSYEEWLLADLRRDWRLLWQLHHHFLFLRSRLQFACNMIASRLVTRLCEVPASCIDGACGAPAPRCWRGFYLPGCVSAAAGHQFCEQQNCPVQSRASGEIIAGCLRCEEMGSRVLGAHSWQERRDERYCE